MAELRMEDDTIIKNETQMLDVIENYFSTSADSATWDGYDEYIKKLCHR